MFCFRNVSRLRSFLNTGRTFQIALKMQLIVNVKLEHRGHIHYTRILSKVPGVRVPGASAESALL